MYWWINSADSLSNLLPSTNQMRLFFPDASSQGWGGVLGELRSGGNWTALEATHHMNYLEMPTVLRHLKEWYR